MRNRFVLALVLSFFVAVDVKRAAGLAPGPTPWANPESNTGALKGQVTTGGSYDAHSGNATRIVNDLNVPDALGAYGLDFTRYWNSVHNEETNLAAEMPTDFGNSGWTHSWRWEAVYDEEIPETQVEPPPHTWVTSITITFPDGHATKFKISRSNANPTAGPPYSGNGETILWPTAGLAVHDRLAEMEWGGREFWLYRADGGAVQFVAVGLRWLNGRNVWIYEAKRVYDPYGFYTELFYYDTEPLKGKLKEVRQEGGRSLKLTWGGLGGLSVITKVETGGPAAGQWVNYYYTKGGAAYTLAQVQYQDQPSLNQTASAYYSYSRAFGDDPNGPLSDFPVLKSADDPHFSGAMTKIRYKYKGELCAPPNTTPDPIPEHFYSWFYFQAHAIAEERSETGIMVSQFASPCHSGGREEFNGIGGQRSFYFGDWAEDSEIDSIYGYQLTKLTDFGRANQSRPFRKQAGGAQPEKIWDGRSKITEFEYLDESGSPSEARYMDGSNCTYDRINPGESATPDGSRIRNKQDHWLFSKKDENNQVTVYKRDNRRRVTDIYYHDAAGTQVASESYTYNHLNQVETHTLPSGVIQHYEYDGFNRLAREWNLVDRAGHGPIADRVYAYDALGRVATMLEGRAATADGPFTVRMTYNGRHKVLSVESASPNGQYPTVRYEYDKYGNCTAITNELGHRSTYTYDSYRRCTSYTEPLNAPGWDGNGTVPSRTWEWAYDRLIPGVGQFGASAHTSAEWRIQVEPVFNQHGQRRMTARHHDVNNRITAETTGLIATSLTTGENGGDAETHYFTYDKNGQKETYTDPRERVTTYEYNNRNRLSKTIEHPMPGSGGASRTTETLYDPTGNKLEVKFPDLTTQRWENYDAFGQPGKFFNENNNLTDLIYCWGPMKKLYKVIAHRDGEDQLTQFSYDQMGRPTQTLFHDGSDEFSTYKFGQLDTFKTRRGQTKVIDQYDARGREKHHYWLTHDGITVDSSTPAITRVWDDANRLTSIANMWSTIEYGYDDAGQAKWERSNVVGADGGPAQVTYYRFPSGEVSRTIYPNQTSVQRFYTARGQLKDVGWGAGATSYLYHPDGKVKSQFRTNGVATSYGYDGRGMIGALEHKNGSDQSLAYREYWRDERDRITAWKRGSGGGLNGMEDGRGDRYKYDPEGQLERAWYRALNPWTAEPGDPKRGDHFHYDALGNRVGWNDVASRGAMNFTRKNNGLNQYLQWENPYPSPNPLHWGTTTNYDADKGGMYGTPGQANGVLMEEGYITAGFNALNQPMSIWSKAYPGGASPPYMHFGYDPLGRCVKRWKSTGAAWTPGYNPATYYYYDGWNLIQEGPSGATADRVYVHGGRVDEIVASAGSQWYNHHYDARGHCILLTSGTSGNGTLLEQYDYDAFGFPYFYSAAGAKQGHLLHGNRFLFTGREWLSDLRLYDYRNRMYHPELGRFLQPDPKHFTAGDYNLYRYCHNDPVNKTDPTGLAYDEEMLSMPEGSGAIGRAIAAATNAVVQHISRHQEIYLGAVLSAGEAYRTKGFSSGMGPTRNQLGYRYVSGREAKVIEKTGAIPKVDAAGKPKPVFYTNEHYDSASAAQKALSLDNTPEFRVEFSLSQAPAGYGGLAGGGGAEFTLLESAGPIPIIKIDPLGQ